MDLRRHARDWVDLGNVDPLWAALTAPWARHQRWDASEFMRTGEREASWLLGKAAELGYPRRRGRALDFGCGAGRVSRALSASFDEVHGVDISEPMLARARALASDRPNCRFIVNHAADLKLYPDRHFDLVYSNRVLQHLPGPAPMRAYLRELARVVAAEGLLVVQVPTWLSLRRRLQLRRRAYRLLRCLGVSEGVLLGSLALHPMRMCALPETEVREALGAAGCAVIAVESEAGHQPGIESRCFFAHR
ncbi:MAG: class I SAM-dependent methyltransferase [Myxococcales bacterium]|nr:class I SAM-dependent methyltransferase [Myxococcales bacterium]